MDSSSVIASARADVAEVAPFEAEIRSAPIATGRDTCLAMDTRVHTSMLRSYRSERERAAFEAAASSEAPLFTQRLRHAAMNERGVMHWVNKECNISYSRSMSTLYHQSLLVARSLLCDLKAVPGSRIIICYPFGLDVVPAIFGCFLAGVVAVPVFPPDPHNMKKALSKLALIVSDCGAQLALSTAGYIKSITLQKLASLQFSWPKLKWYATDTRSHATAASTRFSVKDLEDELRALLATGGECYAPPGDSMAMLQYTSGSTSNPKGVVITHSMFAYNCIMPNTVVSPVVKEPRMFVWLPVSLARSHRLYFVFGSCFSNSHLSGVP